MRHAAVSQGRGGCQQARESATVRRSPFGRWREFATLSLALLLAAATGAVEYVSGYDFHLTALFLIPICWAAWTLSRRAGLFLALVSSIVWVVSDLMTGHPYKRPAIPYWNGFMLMAFFVVIVYLLSAFQDAHKRLLGARALLENQNERLEETVRQRTASLQAEMAERKRLEQATL